MCCVCYFFFREIKSYPSCDVVKIKTSTHSKARKAQRKIIKRFFGWLWFSITPDARATTVRPLGFPVDFPALTFSSSLSETRMRRRKKRCCVSSVCDALTLPNANTKLSHRHYTIWNIKYNNIFLVCDISAGGCRASSYTCNYCLCFSTYLSLLCMSSVCVCTSGDRSLFFGNYFRVRPKKLHAKYLSTP